MANRLAQSLSPYLIQHQNNPVDWMPWGNEAFELARDRDVPIFLSVGYAACHWCHVMAHESFEHEEVGAYLNEHFVSIKVDREERPDIDQIYMNAVQLMTGHGGWPMSVFLDHEGRPFYAGTYWPLTPRGGMPGFPQVLDALVDAWTHRRDSIATHAEEITEALQQLAIGTGATGDRVPGADRIGVAVEQLLKTVDQTWGGFGSAPKFPHATDLELMLRVGSRTGDTRLIDAVELTLDRMASGGIRDHIGGGFSRYSVDGRWLVPHFEKMLYDNALLAIIYTRAMQVTGQARHGVVAAEILNYVQRDLIDSSGGIHCSEDADSEGVEGKFYVWHPADVADVLGPERGQRFCQVYDITERGNFEGHSIANLPRPLADWADTYSIPLDELDSELAEGRKMLHLHREQRVKPQRDDKIVVAWNALAIRAFAIASVVMGRDDYLETATRAANFIHDSMRDNSGKLLHVYRNGTAPGTAFVDDHALLAEAMITLYEATADEAWLQQAVALSDEIVDRFSDAGDGGFYYTANDSGELITRNKDWHDGSLVSGNAAASMALLKLARLTGSERFYKAASDTLRAGETVIRTQSRACSALISVLDELHHHQGELVIALSEGACITSIARQQIAAYRPGLSIAWVRPNGSSAKSPLAGALIAGKAPLGDSCTLYRCRDYHCESPMIDP
ncbi:thioredoxin domain-containing protein [Allorhodopirellula heiligendammensis]|uniref:N-acylglucosamine 2-epimerase (GlcNAc 2-epimerase) n=1 Tax=Allorhodopirellula heiligendammensis TaxID=2714739 RepID=A0A5C6BHC9_9BACT|nr:thioredoxin domain-containing protein [Allorhodopirellula heiligendammensis]TWU10679.1 N-acylglucosamine 2-epimerase (GlcNAc 2-epimerase) [Allorhodopirellula heiligendammensis]